MIDKLSLQDVTVYCGHVQQMDSALVAIYENNRRVEDKINEIIDILNDNKDLKTAFTVARYRNTAAGGLVGLSPAPEDRDGE
jgi:ferritin